MKLRPPATPLITVDPYFSVWSFTDKLYDEETKHWTGAANTINGTVTIDGEEFRFLGKGNKPAIGQTDSDVTALVSSYTFRNEKIVLKAEFFTPLFIESLYYVSRPVSYLKLSHESADGKTHDVSVRIEASEELVLDKAGDGPVTAEETEIAGMKAVRMGSADQRMLTRCGDDLRIEWGYLYLASGEDASVSVKRNDMAYISLETKLGNEAVILFAYDDVKCLEYFGKPVDAYWKKDGKTIAAAISEAYAEADEVLAKCNGFSADLYAESAKAGGEKYADLTALAFRQAIAAHKLAADENGEAIFISKECFSNGCTATVDVTYPSSPLFLKYNTELLKGMLRPIFRFADTDEWQFDFAPHDVGTYPLVNGQRYGWKSKSLEEYKTKQMPVEECGNMLVLMAAISMKDGNTEFADRYKDTLVQWVAYLEKYGEDPENQLCTDDFAGHLAHNCNLSLKAIMGIAGYAKLLAMSGDEDGAAKYTTEAKEMADSWVKRAAEPDGSFRLAFDRPGTFSMKYNIIWDKLWNTELFAPSVKYSEFASNRKRFNAYGMPLDNRRSYTKSDWLLWTATLAPTKEEFEAFIAPMWNAYNVTPSRVPLTDWYDTVTGLVTGFRNRTVQGGLFIKLLEF